MDSLQERLKVLQYQLISPSSESSPHSFCDRVALIQQKMQKYEELPLRISSLFAKFERIQTLLDEVSTQKIRSGGDHQLSQSQFICSDDTVPLKAKEAFILSADLQKLSEMSHSLQTLHDLMPYIQFEQLKDAPNHLQKMQSVLQKRTDQHARATDLSQRAETMANQYADLVDALSRKFLFYELQLTQYESLLRLRDVVDDNNNPKNNRRNC